MNKIMKALPWIVAVGLLGWFIYGLATSPLYEAEYINYLKNKPKANLTYTETQILKSLP